MSTAVLNLHSGGHLVSVDELRAIKAPPPEGRWFPSDHSEVLDRVTTTLGEAGYQVQSQSLAVAHNGARFFGTLDLAMPLAAGVTLAVGVRNSFDKSYPIGFCAGSRVFVCSNLAFRAELLVRRKHTLRGMARFATDISEAVTKLGTFKEEESRRIQIMQTTPVREDHADSLILRAYEKGIVPAPALPRVIREWRKPSFEDFEQKNLWSLYNCFTTILMDKAISNPHAYAARTMRLSGHLTADIAPLAVAV